MSNRAGVQRAIDVAGSQLGLSAALDVTPQVISMWLAQGWVPRRRAVEIEELYGIPRGETCSPAMAAFLRSESESERGV